MVQHRGSFLRRYIASVLTLHGSFLMTVIAGMLMQRGSFLKGNIASVGTLHGSFLRKIFKRLLRLGGFMIVVV